LREDFAFAFSKFLSFPRVVSVCSCAGACSSGRVCGALGGCRARRRPTHALGSRGRRPTARGGAQRAAARGGVRQSSSQRQQQALACLERPEGSWPNQAGPRPTHKPGGRRRSPSQEQVHRPVEQASVASPGTHDPVRHSSTVSKFLSSLIYFFCAHISLPISFMLRLIV
jgi:hypothetical protein